MIRNPRERQDHHDAMRALFAQPDYTPVKVGKRIFTLTLMKRCPHCKSVFFAYEPQGRETADYPEIDQDPAEGLGMRGTCGNPLCHEHEVRHRMSMRPSYLAACQSSYPDNPNPYQKSA